jgi:hypothetical protein
MHRPSGADGGDERPASQAEAHAGAMLCSLEDNFDEECGALQRDPRQDGEGRDELSDLGGQQRCGEGS